VALYLQSPTCLGGVYMDYECGDTRKLQVDRETYKLWNLNLSFAIVVITINNEAWWAGLAECGGWRAVLC